MTTPSVVAPSPCIPLGDLASAKWAPQQEGEVEFPWLLSLAQAWLLWSHITATTVVATVSASGTAVLISAMLGFATARNSLLTRQPWLSDTQLFNLPEHVRCEAAGNRKTVGFKNPKYLAQSHCSATDNYGNSG